MYTLIYIIITAFIAFNLGEIYQMKKEMKQRYGIDVKFKFK
jgi:hypothetical protein